MKTVYVIGAGCTRNYQPSNEFGLQSPLDNNFFEICNSIFLARKDLLDAFSDLVEHLSHLFGFELGSRKLSRSFSMETVTTILDLESREKGRRYIDSLINLICIVFDLVLKGPVSSIHKELAEHLEPDDTIISYNYDIVLDNALMDVKKLDESIYKLNFDQKHNDDWRPCENRPTDISLLKLHGSMNWLKCGRCGALLFYEGRKAVAELSYQIMKLEESTNEFNCPVCQARELSAILIPPLLEKEMYSEEFRYPWNLAEKSLISAEKIVVIGYSLPPTDFYSEFLFRQAFSRRFRSKPQLCVVDKNLGLVPKRFESVFGVSDCEKYEDLRKYLDGFG
jgi:NAD-dependent SIR2 family protein deacetylase